MNKITANIVLFLSTVFLLAADLPARADVVAGNGAAVELRGYGSVKASFENGQTFFQCVDAAHADILLGKLLADLFWDAGGQVTQRQVEVDGAAVTVHAWAPYGVLSVGRIGSQVMAIGADDDAALLTRLRQHPEFVKGSPVFIPEKPYPLFLDFFDLGAVKSYTYCMQSARGEGLSSHWPFLRKFGLSGTAYHLGGGMISSKSPAPGILNFVDSDFEVREAERNHGLIMPGISPGGALPVWADNLFPDGILRNSPTGIGEDDLTARLVEGYGMPRAERERAGLWSLRETMRRYLASPAIGCWQILDGPNGIEVLSTYQQNADFSPTGLQSYRSFLKDVKGFDLKTVGLRYFSDPGHYQSWDDVMPLDANGFIGNLDESCLLLKDWRWQPADSTATAPPANADANWRNIVIPGSDQMHTIPVSNVFYQIAFDAGGWMAKNPDKDWRLICGRIFAKKPARMKVWLNGKDLGEQGIWDGAVSRPVAVKVNGILKPGRNELSLLVPQGKLFSPFFLTTHQAEEYPTSNKMLNARYVDLRDWHYHSIAARNRDAFELARGIDPDRPFVLPAGGGWEVSGALSEIATSLGSAVQNTGREAFYQPWWARQGRVAGYYGSSEPSGITPADPAKPANLSRLFGWILIDSDASHTLYWQLEDYIGIERETGWFTKNKRLLQLVGKSLPLPPQVVIFRSAQTMRYSPEHYSGPVWRWDLGRGEMNDAHYNWGYASEGELHRGLPKTCKVLVDAGSEVMEQKTVDAIAVFVSSGGTYIALHNTGRHDPLEANAWPISRLTGCKVVGEKARGKIRFEQNLPVFKGWEGRELECDGIAMDWMGDNHATGQSVQLAPQSGDVQVLAKWADGSAAVTSRSLGKGRVICLGSSFWRNARDKNGAWITRDDKLKTLERLFTDLGVERTSDATSPAIWVNDGITKNGLESWLIAFNTSQTPETADLEFRSAVQPTEVRELVAGTSVPFDYADGRVHLKGISFENNQTKVFAVKRAGLAGGLPFWWGEKTTYWKKADVPAVRDGPSDTVRLGTLRIDAWKFLADRDGSVSASNDWTNKQIKGAAWETMETGPWNALIPELKNYTGIGLYRSSFTIPTEWNGLAVSLNVYGDRLPKIFGTAEFFLNGKKIGNEPFQQDLGRPGYPARLVIDGFLEKGDNTLAVKITGGAKWGKEDFSGFGGTVYLAAEKPLEPVLNLDGKWTRARQNGSATEVPLPISKASGKYLAKVLEIPASWSGRTIYLRLETETPWLEGIMVNNKLLLSGQFRRMGRYVEWNVTPWVEPGKAMRVELWDRALPLYNPVDPKKPAADSTIDLLSAKIGCVE